VRIGITGSAGFIGRSLRDDLREAGHACQRFDVAEVEDEDVRDRAAVVEWVADCELDLVVHLAAEVGKLNCELNPRRAVEVNVYGTLCVAQVCAKFGVPLVYVSTSEVYGDHDGRWVDEETAPSDRLSGAYAITKLAGEQVAQTYAPEGLRIIRPTMPYGPGVPPGPGRRALDNFVLQALRDQPITVHAGAARSWCWVDDVAHGMRTVIEHGPPGIYNVGRSDDEVAMGTLARRIIDITGSSSTIKVVEPPTLQVPVKRISCAKLSKLGWVPEVSLEQGLPRMVSWVQRWERECAT
jgi:nucleoside-diphosphate-sugar epimerase